MIRLRSEDTKEKKAKKVLISKTLRTILMQVPGRGGNDYVFRYKGSAISNVRSGFVAGCKEAGIQYGREGGFVFHDLRHTAKTIARMAGVDKNVRMVIFGRNRQNWDLLKNSHYHSHYRTKKALKTESLNRITN